eukprot:CAMPEP_0113658690 /NCGR_PEP_ID=MMETSP0017_2-20120614/31912_1 /TAXON_ID=2856 /ORGANISM="Cylindrotheca closterium" /LENGTH=683 /DNA_ID=CAMNT_0000573097 /DNA_START=202 /DNA_END=2253 /DNA_ORIENTATION=- /assembly_acc=CAM_ASM_000147
MRFSLTILSLLIGSYLVCRSEALPTSKSVWRNHDDDKKEAAQNKTRSIRGGGGRATNKMQNSEDPRSLPTSQVAGRSRRLEDYEWWCEDGEGWYYFEYNDWILWGSDSDCPAGNSGGNIFVKVPADTLTLVGDNGEPTYQFPLAKCEGDCDSDNECMGNLICSQRRGTEAVAGCKGSGISGKDYCTDRSSNAGGGNTSGGGSSGGGSSNLFSYGGSPPQSAFPLQRCEGDCDSDSNCAQGLYCLQRDGGDPVPGCNGSDDSRTDYCVPRGSTGGGSGGGTTGSNTGSTGGGSGGGTTDTNTGSGCPRQLGTEACPYITDVIIVGAGSAGLIAANDLKMQGMSVTILEASSGYGGRVQKVAPFGFYMDAGASWASTESTRGVGYFGHPNDVFTPLVNRNVDVSGYTRRDLGIAYYYEDGYSYREDYADSDFRWIDYTYWDFLNDQVVQPYRLQDNIVNRCVVNYIWYDNQYAWAICSDGRVYESYNIIVTVSIAILQQNSIQFEPQLPSNHRNAISNYVFGRGLKVALEFRAKFYYHIIWKDGIMFFDEMFGHNIPNKHVLTCFIYGSAATTFQGMSNSAIVQKLINDLNIIYGGQASSQFKGNYYVKHWTNEPYVRGAYVEDAPAWAMRAMQQPVGGGTLHFAGEGIPVDADGWGYVHGAGQSGKRAAYEVRTLYCRRFPRNC